MKLCVLLIKNPKFMLNPSGHSHNNSSSPKSREDKHVSCQHCPTQGTLLSPSSCELNPASLAPAGIFTLAGISQHCFKFPTSSLKDGCDLSLLRLTSHREGSRSRKGPAASGVCFSLADTLYGHQLDLGCCQHGLSNVYLKVLFLKGRVGIIDL